MSSSPPTPKIAVLISGNGSNLQAIIEHQQAHADLYDIALVVSNRPNAYGLERARQANIATQVIDHTFFESRKAFDDALQASLEAATVDWVLLAGFMRILTPKFSEHFLGKMINIHPSLLPKYPGLHTHQRALDNQEQEHGLSIHFVTPELDGGPVILQAKVTVSADETMDTLAQKVHQQEHKAYPLVVEWCVTNQLALHNNQVIFNKDTLQTPLNLSDYR